MLSSKTSTRGISTIAIVAIIFVGLIIVAIAFRVGSGQGFEPINTTLPGQHSSSPANSPAGANAGELAPDFTLTSLDGQRLSLADFRGEKPVVLDFFATWCPNCRRDMPKLQALYDKYGDDIEIIAINLNESRSKVEKFVNDNGFTYPVAMDPGRRVARQYQVNYTNTHVYIGRDGVIKQTQYSDTSEAIIVSLIN